MDEEPRLLAPDPRANVAVLAVPFGALFGLGMGSLFGCPIGAIATAPLGPGAIGGAFCCFLGAAVISGVSAGAMYGAMMAAFASSVGRAGQRPDGLQPDERVLVEGPANRFRGLEGVGGWLWLTDRRLRFESHGANFHRHDGDWPLAGIGAIAPGRSLGFLENQIVGDIAGVRERLVVHRPREWITAIEAAAAARST